MEIILENLSGSQKSVRQLSPALFNLYVDDIISIQVQLMKEKYINVNVSLKILNFIHDFVLSLDSQAICKGVYLFLILLIQQPIC